ncbi:P-loop containing nucleoside triphosphate hydrolase protein [Leptodontidium sp. MPI-SDFR-AT-0119]|nr:P-loop containing nucleoside triphosphate hydrolase protein [Leptodontidium sp. MPI-SDFR-AT-0119]
MAEKRHENNNVLDHIFGAVFLGTPHIEDASRLDLNIVESIVRASAAPFSFFSFTPEDNRSIAQISRGFSGFGGQVVSTFENIESRYRGVKWRGPFSKTRLSAGEIDGELYNAIARIIDAAVLEHKLSSTPQGIAERSELHADGSVLDGWDMQSLWSHRSRMAKPIADASSKNTSDVERPQETDQSRCLPPPSPELKQNSKTPSASGGYSSQFSYEVVPSPSHLELDKPKLSIPCFSVGSQSRKSPFFGRDDILRSIDKSLLPESVPSPIDEESIRSSGNLKTFALCGPGGIGKTELASEYVFTRKDRYSAIFWVTADSRNVLLEDFARIAIELGLQHKNEAQDLAEACELVKGWLCNPVKDLESPLGSPDNEIPWLLVLDNVDDWGTIEDFWPTTGIGSILITSRDPLSRSHIYTAKHGLDLDPLSESESLEFLDAVSQKPFKGSPASAKAVAEWAGGLPLIITAIASTMTNRNLTYNKMQDLLKTDGFEAVSADRKPQVHSVHTLSIASMIGLARLDERVQSWFMQSHF